MHDLKVGDELAFPVPYESDYFYLRKIEKISPSGRITIDGRTLNPDLSIRGADTWGKVIRAYVPDQRIRDGALRYKAKCTFKKLDVSKLTTDQLTRICAILDEPK